MNYFPTALASGRAFCNRKEELQRILYNLKNTNPTLLVSPRRYGKTSLALKSFEDVKWPYAHVDLYKALSEDDIARFILNGIGRLLGRMESTPLKLMKAATEFFSGFQLKFALEKYGLSVEFSKKEKQSVDLILAALEKLENHAAKRKKRVIMFLDELQVLAEVVNNSSIEAAIREAAQKSKHVSYVFSGSNRHLIEVMFNDKKRPFYNLCDTITLSRIKEEDYVPYINKAAKERWKKPLSQHIFESIFSLTELHPYYINKLCSQVWQQSKLPDEASITNSWNRYVAENKSGIERELSLLSVNQRKLLINLSEENGILEPFSQQFAMSWGMSATSIHRAMESLLERDYIFKDAQGKYRILDPLIKSILQTN
jgi:hypothetical protein